MAFNHLMMSAIFCILPDVVNSDRLVLPMERPPNLLPQPFRQNFLFNPFLPPDWGGLATNEAALMRIPPFSPAWKPTLIDEATVAFQDAFKPPLTPISAETTQPPLILPPPPEVPVVPPPTYEVTQPPLVLPPTSPTPSSNVAPLLVRTSHSSPPEISSFPSKPVSFPQNSSFPPHSSTSSSSTIFPSFPSQRALFPQSPRLSPFIPTVPSSTTSLPTPPVTPVVPPMMTNIQTKVPKQINIDPEAIMSVTEIIRHWGYPVEEHHVVTEDGYVLKLHRIPHGKHNGNSTAFRPIIFLQHGLLCTSSIWLLNLPDQSAEFLEPSRPKDWEEMSEYDLPAMIDYVLEVTKQPSLYYVGHSQGTLTMFAKLSRDQRFAKKIRKFFALAPVSRLAHTKGIFQYLGQIYEQFKLIYRLIGDGEFLPNNIFTRLLTNIICDDSVNHPLCENLLLSVSGPNSNQLNTSRIGIYLAHNPGGTSTRNMLHFAQMVRTKRMAPFDGGPESNLNWYGQVIPPEYNISQVHADTYLFYSDYDWLASAVDTEQYLIPNLPKTSIKFARRLREFNHNDFLLGLRARKEIYDPIVNIIKIDTRRLMIQRNLKLYFKNRTIDLPRTEMEQLMITSKSLELE